jgi:hypothetical protein
MPSPGTNKKEVMTEEENVGEEILEVATPSEAEHSEEPAAIQEDPATRNWKEMRHLAREQQRQIRAYEDRLAQLEAQLKTPAQPLDEEDPDDLATIAKVDKRAMRAAEKIAEQKIQQALKQKAYEDMQERMRDRHEDFDEVMRYYDEVVEEDPALAAYFVNSKNPFQAAYKKIKESPTFQRHNASTQVSPKAEKIIKNMEKPMRSATAGKPAEEDLGRMTPQQVWDLAQRYAQGY